MKSNSFGGVWFVNKTLSDEFVKKGYKVELIGIRKEQGEKDFKEKLFSIKTINNIDKWR